MEVKRVIDAHLHRNACRAFLSSLPPLFALILNPATIYSKESSKKQNEGIPTDITSRELKPKSIFVLNRAKGSLTKRYVSLEVYSLNVQVDLMIFFSFCRVSLTPIPASLSFCTHIPFLALISSTEHLLMTRDSNDNHSAGHSSTQVSGGYLSSSSCNSSIKSLQPQLPPLEPSHDFSVDSNSSSDSRSPSSSSILSCVSSHGGRKSPPANSRRKVSRNVIEERSSLDLSPRNEAAVDRHVGVDLTSQTKSSFKRVKRSESEHQSLSHSGRNNTKYTIDELLKDSNGRNQEVNMISRPMCGLPTPFPSLQVFECNCH